MDAIPIVDGIRIGTDREQPRARDSSGKASSEVLVPFLCQVEAPRAALVLLPSDRSEGLPDVDARPVAPSTPCLHVLDWHVHVVEADVPLAILVRHDVFRCGAGVTDLKRFPSVVSSSSCRAASAFITSSS